MSYEFIGVITTVVIQIIIVAFFVGVYANTINNQNKNIKELKTYFSEKIDDIKENFKAHLDRVEAKQDKHNNLIERMVRVEDSSKSAHHRIDKLEGDSNGYFRKGN